MHEKRDTLWHFAMSIVKYRESHEVTVLDMYEEQGLFKNCVISFTVPQTPLRFITRKWHLHLILPLREN